MFYFILSILIIFVVFLLKSKNSLQHSKKQKEILYFKKPLVTEQEKYFFNILVNNFFDYYIIPQTNLASIINKKKEFNKQWQNELYRNIDFAIINKTTFLPELLIEINDKTHNPKSRIERDKKVRQICLDAKINLITFYSNMPNKESYIIDRIKSELEKR